MPDIAVFLPWTAAADLLNPVRKLCDPTHRYTYEIYCRLNYVEVVAIDCGPVEKTVPLVPADAEIRIRHD